MVSMSSRAVVGCCTIAAAFDHSSALLLLNLTFDAACCVFAASCIAVPRSKGPHIPGCVFCYVHQHISALHAFDHGW